MTARDKADRLLAEGRLVVTEVTRRHVDALVQGDTGVYRVVYGDGCWSCSCPAWGGCSHVMAAQLVTSVVKLPQWARVRLVIGGEPG